MIVYFLLIILLNIINGDNTSDTKYIETLPANVKKNLLDKVARRIVNEVPDVNSRDTEVNGDVLADKLEKQSEFVKKILKQEVESIKARRRHYRKRRKFRKSGNDNNTFSGNPGLENVDINDTQSSELHLKPSVSDKIDIDAGHIDLTLRSGRSKRGGTFLDANETVIKNDLAKYKLDINNSGFIPVTIHIDGEDTKKKTIKNSNENTTEVFKVQKTSEEDMDIQIKSSKQGEQKKSGNNKREISEHTMEKADGVTETSTQNHLSTESTLKIEDSSVKMYFGRRTDDLDLNKTEQIFNTVTVNVSTVSDGPNTNANNNPTLDDYTTTYKIFETTAGDGKDISIERDEDITNSTDHASKDSTESYLENPIIYSKGRKSLEALNTDENTTQSIEETPVKSKSEINNSSAFVTKEPHGHYSEITTLNMVTTVVPYPATTVGIEASDRKSTNTATDLGIGFQKEFETTNKHNREENKLTVTEISTATQKSDYTNEVRNSSTILNANDTKINDKKPCNETRIKVGEITDCDKKRNKIDNSTPETPTAGDKVDDEPKAKATVDTVVTEFKESLQTDIKKPCNETNSKLSTSTDCDKKIHQTDNSTTDITNATEVNIDKPKANTMVDDMVTEPKVNLRTTEQKPFFDSLIHFGDMQITKEYEVYELDSSKPAFVKQNEKGKNNIEQPRYAPVYNYDPKNAYFNAYNRLGPNEDEDDEDYGNEHVVGSKTLRMSHIDREKQKNLDQTTEDDSTTKAYYSAEKDCQEKEVEEVKENDDDGKEEEEVQDVYEPMYTKEGHIHNPHIKNHINHIRLTNYQHKIFGYVPTHRERKKKIADEVRYLYNNVLGKSTEEILDETKEDHTKYLRINRDGRYYERVNTRKDKTERMKKDAKNIKKVEVIVVDMNKNKTPVSRQGGYFSSKYKWDEEGNSFTNEGKVYNLDYIVPYSTERSLILEQRKESNKILDRIKGFANPPGDNNSAETMSQAKPEDIKKSLDFLQNLNTNKTLFNKSSIDAMVKGVDSKSRPPIPLPKPQHFQYLKQRLIQTRHQNGMQDHAILRSTSCLESPNCAFQLYGLTIDKPEKEPPEKKESDEVLNSISKITEITPEVDMLNNIESMLQINGFPVARRRDDDIELYVRILRDMVKMDNKALEDYDWLGTTVAIQSALAKLKEIINQKKHHQHIHPSDSQLFNYVEALYTEASKVAKGIERENLDEHKIDLTQERKANDERMALPKTHKKIKNPLKILQQISDLVNKKVLRDKADTKTRETEVFLDCMQQCLDDFHTVIKELTRITKYNQQRWYKNIKELYLPAGGRKEYLEVLLHLYSMRLFSLIDESADNGVEVNYRTYMKENKVEVDRTLAEMVFVIRILKAISELRVN